MIRRLLAIPALALGLLASPALTGIAGAMEPYHIKANPNNNHLVHIWSEWSDTYGCLGGSTVSLNAGQVAKSTGWDCFRVTADNFNVLVYSGSTGQLLADRNYPAGAEVKTYNPNRYYVTAI